MRIELFCTKPPVGMALMPTRCVVLFAKDYFLLSAKAISGKERLADQYKGLTQKYLGGGLVRGSLTKPRSAPH